MVIIETIWGDGLRNWGNKCILCTVFYGLRESLSKWVVQHGVIQKNVSLKNNSDEKQFQKLALFSSFICCHCSKWVLFIYAYNNMQLKSFVYECHTCITIIHCETVMGKMVFKANLHIHKSKISCMKTKLSLLFFLLRMKKVSKYLQKEMQSKVLKMRNFHSERVSHVDDNETAQWIPYSCFRKCLENRILYTVKMYYWGTTLTAHSYSSNGHFTSE